MMDKIFAPEFIGGLTAKELLIIMYENGLSGVEAWDRWDSTPVTDITYLELVGLVQTPSCNDGSHDKKLPINTYGHFYKIINGQKYFCLIDMNKYY